MSGVKISTGDFIGWCHADLQTEPRDVYDAFLNNKDKLKNQNYIIKGLRKNRNIFDEIFTLGMSLIASVVFLKKLMILMLNQNYFLNLFYHIFKTILMILVWTYFF